MQLLHTCICNYYGLRNARECRNYVYTRWKLLESRVRHVTYHYRKILSPRRIAHRKINKETLRYISPETSR